MPLPRLFVFFGKPGVGKTTLIQAALPTYRRVDVRPFVRAYGVSGVMPEEKTLIGYQDMYRYLGGLNEQVVVLELGTNHPEFNVQQLVQLQPKRDIHLFLCTASVETCRQRMRGRIFRDDAEAMERRLQRDFPNAYLQLLRQTSLHYHLIDLEQPLEQTNRIVREYLAKVGVGTNVLV